MANYIGSSRTNYFRVDPAKQAEFDAWTQRFDLEVHPIDNPTGDPALAGLVCLLTGDCTDDGTFPSCDPDTDEEVPFVETLATFLAPGSVAVVKEVGAEKLRYLSGWAVAVDHTGQQVQVTLHDIYEKALAAFPDATITRAEY
jgi:hypothetical protein